MSPEEMNEKLALLQKVLNEKLIEACEDGNYHKAEEAIAQGADVNCRNTSGWTPIHIAVDLGRYDILALLIKKNAYINSTTPGGDTALSIAKIINESKGSFTMFNFLKQYGAQECSQM